MADAMNPSIRLTKRITVTTVPQQLSSDNVKVFDIKFNPYLSNQSTIIYYGYSADAQDIELYAGTKDFDDIDNLNKIWVSVPAGSPSATLGISYAPKGLR